MIVKMTQFRTFAAALAMLLPIAALADTTFLVQFRDLFFQGGKPSPRATWMSGATVELTGFLTPPPDEESPFLVLVGVPTTICPYCTSVDEQDHLPYVLVYPDTPFDRSNVTSRTRIRVRGTLNISHEFEGFYGIHNDVRILAAQVERDERSVNPVQQRLRAKTSSLRPTAAPMIDE